MAIGFLLDAGLRFDAGAPVVELWGVLADGSSFLLRDRRSRPYLFVRTADAGRARAAGAPVPEPTRLASMRGEPVSVVVVGSPAELRAARTRLEAARVPTYEADLRPAIRWLLDRDVRGALSIEGVALPGRGVTHLFEDASVAPARFVPRLRVLSLDIETDPEASRVLSAALHHPGGAEVLVVAGGGGALPPGAVEHRDERALLRGLAARVRALDPDVLTGWNVVGFDLRVLERRASALGLALRLGRGDSPLRVRGPIGRLAPARARIEGRAVVDGIDLFRGAFLRVEDYRLDTVARTFLGRGKTLHGPARAEEILRLFETDLAAFCTYNLNDAALVSELIQVTGLLDLAVGRSLMTGMPLDRVASSIASFDALYLPELRRRGFVAPTLASTPGADASAQTTGGAVLEPSPGLHELVLHFDFRSLYPSLMRTFNVDPLTHVQAKDLPDSEVVLTPSGARFARTPGILPALLGGLMEERARAKGARDATSSQATKILMNSFYGVLASSACRFHSPEVANAITETGQWVLYWTKSRVEQLGHAVLYGDTDSLFVSSGARDEGQALALGAALARRLTDDLTRHLRITHDVESHLELRLEGVFLRLFFPLMRHGPGAARKRYAGLRATESGPELIFVGLESVRRDWTDAAREFQNGLYARLFAGEGGPQYVREFVRSVRSGERDAQLVYRKALRKGLAEYTATTPPHVKAARLEPGGGRLVEYVMTVRGPEPISAAHGRLDYEHYVEKQLRPIAEAVMPHLGAGWDELAGNPRQLSLWGDMPRVAEDAGLTPSP